MSTTEKTRSKHFKESLKTSEGSPELLEKKEPSEKLGFEKLETAEIVSNANTALSTYQIFFHKLQNFHWNVIGSDFFDLHDITEDLYNSGLEDIDEIAERIRILGHTPLYRLTDYMEQSLIKESTHELSAKFMARELLHDFPILIESLIGWHEASAKSGDVGTTYLASKIIKRLETEHWKMNSWVNRKYEMA